MTAHVTIHMIDSECVKVILHGSREMTLTTIVGKDAVRRANAYATAVRECLSGTREPSRQVKMRFDRQEQKVLF